MNPPFFIYRFKQVSVFFIIHTFVYISIQFLKSENLNISHLFVFQYFFISYIFLKTRLASVYIVCRLNYHTIIFSRNAIKFFVFLSQNLEERLGKRAEISQLLFKNRCNTVNEIIEKALYFFPKTFINFNIFKLIF